jgi:hypothetical protein
MALHRKRCNAVLAPQILAHHVGVAADAVATIDRLVHHSTILEFNVESYRRKAAERTREKNSRRTTVASVNDA